MLNSATVAAACETAGRYLHVHNEAAKLSFDVDDELAYLSYTPVNVELAELRQFSEYGMTVAVNTLRIMVESNWSPREIHFAHQAPNETSEHVRIFRAPVLFGCATNALVTERKFCEQPVLAADPNLFKILSRYLDDVLSHIPRDEMLASIRRTIAELMKDGSPKLARVAKNMAVSPRTLQRQLKSYGIEFKAMVDDTRRQFALDYLKDHESTLTEIAFLLGYS